MKTKVYNIKGGVKSEIELPLQFREDYRPDLIKRAVIASQKNRRRPMSVNKMAGQRSSAKFSGIRKGYGHSYNMGAARIPRLMIRGGRRAGAVRLVPQSVKGRRAHPPKILKNLNEKINIKERRKAIRSAIKATSIKEIIFKRGHVIENVKSLPLVVEDQMESLKKTKDVEEMFKAIGVWGDIKRASVRKIRAGKGKRRGRKYKQKKGPIVIINDDKGIAKAAKNLPGVEVSKVNQLNAEKLAPGTMAGRLAIWSESAIKALGKGLYN